jgi:hypothetical protein
VTSNQSLVSAAPSKGSCRSSEARALVFLPLIPTTQVGVPVGMAAEDIGGGDGGGFLEASDIGMGGDGGGMEEGGGGGRTIDVSGAGGGGAEMVGGGPEAATRSGEVEMGGPIGGGKGGSGMGGGGMGGEGEQELRGGGGGSGGGETRAVTDITDI